MGGWILLDKFWGRKIYTDTADLAQPRDHCKDETSTVEFGIDLSILASCFSPCQCSARLRYHKGNHKRISKWVFLSRPKQKVEGRRGHYICQLYFWWRHLSHYKMAATAVLWQQEKCWMPPSSQFKAPKPQWGYDLTLPFWVLELWNTMTTCLGLRAGGRRYPNNLLI